MVTNTYAHLSTRLERLMIKAQEAEKDLISGRYSNGSYSGYAGGCAKSAFNAIETELRELLKVAIKAEAKAELQAELLAEIKIKIGA